MTAAEHDELNLREKIAHIDQMLADRRRRIDADHDRRRQEIRYRPWVAVISGMAAGGALFAAGVAFIKILGGG